MIKFQDIAIPNYPSGKDSNEPDSAIILSMIDLCSQPGTSSMIKDRLNITGNVAVCMATLPVYVNHYAEKHSLDKAKLKQKVTQLIALSRVQGLI